MNCRKIVSLFFSIISNVGSIISTVERETRDSLNISIRVNEMDESISPPTHTSTPKHSSSTTTFRERQSSSTKITGISKKTSHPSSGSDELELLGLQKPIVTNLDNYKSRILEVTEDENEICEHLILPGEHFLFHDYSTELEPMEIDEDIQSNSTVELVNTQDDQSGASPDKIKPFGMYIDENVINEIENFLYFFRPE